MVKLRNSIRHIKHFVLLLTLASAFSCAKQSLAVSRIEGKEIGISAELAPDEKIEKYITPFRDSIEKDLNTVLAYSPQTLDKSQGQWQTPIGNLMADAGLEAANFVFSKSEGKKVDICMLNFGGIRSIIPKGDVTIRTAFEIMPFENSLVVTELAASDIRDMVDYVIAEKKAHPIAGITFTIANGKAEDIRVGGQPLVDERTYFVATSDYLLHGGDRMTFFGRSRHTYDLSYKIRNVLIDYFKQVKTIPVKNDIRISIKP